MTARTDLKKGMGRALGSQSKRTLCEPPELQIRGDALNECLKVHASTYGDSRLWSHRPDWRHQTDASGCTAHTRHSLGTRCLICRCMDALHKALDSLLSKDPVILSCCAETLCTSARPDVCPGCHLPTLGRDIMCICETLHVPCLRLFHDVARHHGYQRNCTSWSAAIPSSIRAKLIPLIPAELIPPIPAALQSPKGSKHARRINLQGTHSNTEYQP